MARWHNQYIDRYVHFCTLTISEWEILLTGEAINILYEVWNESRIKLGVKIMAYVIMPNHFHIVIYSESGNSVMQFMQRSASFMSKRLSPGKSIWKERPRVLPVYSPRVIKAKIDYIHRNPMRKGLAVDQSEWVHSSFNQIYGDSNDIPFTCDVVDGIDLHG